MALTMRTLFSASTLLLLHVARGFTVSPHQQSTSNHRGLATTGYATTRPSSTLLSAASSLVVVSPPGGVGEVAAVKAATLGASVKWFVVSPPSVLSEGVAAPASAQQVVLSQQALKDIQAAGGAVELAGADASSLLLSTDDAQSATAAVSAWCGAADSLICSYDGVDDAVAGQRKQASASEKAAQEERTAVWNNGIKVAAKEAAKSISGTKLAILSADEAVATGEGEEESSSGGGGLGRVVGTLFGGSKVDIPDSLASAMGDDDDMSSSSTLALRYGKLFGTPESSPDFSPLVGGLKKFPELCEEYLMRSVRVDPTLSVSGNLMLSGATTRSSRHAIGEAAALMALGKVPTQPGLDVSLSSQRGNDPVTAAVWEEEFARVKEMLSSGQGAQLFSTEFGSVPNVPRLADWLATKWAPAVLRTYDIAAIRVGSRPVYVTQPQEDVVEIIWQQLVNFESKVVGKMTIQVKDNGLVALRGPGDAAQGFGEISRTPLAGEDVLVRRLAEAASQAIEKGLANKPKVKVSEEELVPVAAAPAKETPAVVTSLQSAGTVEKKPSAEKEASSVKSATGPRQAGVRRSKERARGKRRKSPPPPPASE